jgi:GH24 family phage-related lysozyme (muramidase)
MPQVCLRLVTAPQAPCIARESMPELFLDETTAEQLLAEKFTQLEENVNCLVTWTSLTQNQYDALFSLIYNIYTTNFSCSTLLNRLNAGDTQLAADQFLLWCKLTDQQTKQKETLQG